MTRPCPPLTSVKDRGQQQPWTYGVILAVTWLKLKAGQLDQNGPRGFPFCENYCHLLGKYYRNVLEAQCMLIKKQNEAWNHMYIVLETGNMWTKQGQLAFHSCTELLLSSHPFTRGRGMKKGVLVRFALMIWGTICSREQQGALSQDQNGTPL